MTQAIKTDTFPQLPDYEIVSKIGQGGVAEIYKARQKSLNRFVAIKFLFPELTSDPDIVRRFDREAETIAALNHPHIVHVIDKGYADSRYYFIMEYVDGTSFKDVIHSEEYSIWDKLDFIVMVLKALDYAHKNGVIHRDIKPANILIDKNRHALVADFGIAQIVNRPDFDHTRSDVIMGTLAYMSPEQRESSTNVNLATDIYSVGIMIYEILTGKRPVGRYAYPSEINPNLSGRFDDIIKHCLAENPQERYQTAVELKDGLLNIISGKKDAGTAPHKDMAGVESFIGKCQYLDTIKESKYGSTTLVENRETHEIFMLKKNDRSSTGLREAKVLSHLKHKNIINIYGAGGDLRRMVIMMEYARGGSLADRMVKLYSYEKAMDIIAQVAEGLDFAHKNNIIHGNLRPSNILFSKDETVRLTDFAFPSHYNMMEKNWYAPPERRISKQGDIYGMGVILHQMIFGKNPSYDRAGRLFHGALQNSIPSRLQEILSKLLSIRTANRYHAMDEFLADWREFKCSLGQPEESLEKDESLISIKTQKPYGKMLIPLGLIIIIAIIIYFSLK
jgi:serine/threonine-protein kinase